MLKERFKIDDKITLGVVSSIIGTLLLGVVDYIAFMLNLEKWQLINIAASAYFKVDDVGTLPALFVGGITHLANAGLLGVIICYILYYTGIDFYWLKGIGVSLMFWLFAYGVVLRTHIGRIDPTGAFTNVSHILFHIIGGWLIAYLIIKLAKEGTFERK